MPAKIRETALKAFEVLECFVYLPDATCSEITQRTGLSRSVAYGMLETLVEAGYLYRDGLRDRYRLTGRLGGLCQGLNSVQYAATIVAPRLAALTRHLHWPVDFMVRSGTDMVVLETSDRLSTLSIGRLKRHQAVPILGCAAGLAYIAYCADDISAALQAKLIDGQFLLPNNGRINQAAFDSYLPKIRHGGFARIDISGLGECSLAAPILASGHPVGVLQLRHIASAPVDWRQVGRLIAEEARHLGAQIEQALHDAARPWSHVEQREIGLIPQGVSVN